MSAEPSTAPGDTVVVTGASSGIGKATAEELAAAGFRVFGTVRRAEDGEYLEGLGGQAIPMDVTDPASVTEGREQVSAALGDGRLAGLVNNAGIVVLGPWELVDLETVRHGWEVNVLGVAAVTQAFLPLLRQARGRIVMISSVTRRLAAPFAGPYHCSKVALEGLADSLRRELLAYGVAVVVVEPGAVRTPLWRKLADDHEGLFEGTVYARTWARIRRATRSAGRGGLPPEAVARAVRRALTETRPPRRILVARDALRVRVRGLLPGRLIDRMVARRLG
jgi:NAD(P)-dependent dehydrogenase (short-subunit alcohol dehydrogenase family)